MNGAKNKGLTGNLPIQRAFGIFWNAENDVTKFKIDLKDQSVTRRGMLSFKKSLVDPFYEWVQLTQG